MQGCGYDMMIIIYILSIIILVRVVYRAFFTELKTAIDYHQRAMNYQIYFQNKSKSIKILEQALLNPDFNRTDKGSFHLSIGILYYKMKKFDKAKEHFESILDFIKKDNFSYMKDLSAVVLTYFELGEKDKARIIYHWLRAKEKYDPDFGKLDYLDLYIWKQK